MSWIGLKKAISRAGTQVLVKTGQVEQTVDSEYDFEEKRYRMMEAHSQKLHHDLRKYLESLRIVTHLQLNIGAALASFYGLADDRNDPRRKAPEHAAGAHAYAHTMRTLNEECVGELVEPYHQTVLNPISRFNTYFLEINDVIRKRARKQLDYDMMRAKVRKLVERPQGSAPGDAAYEARLSDAQSQLRVMGTAFETLNTNLKADMARLVNMRVPYMVPSFEAFVKIQLRFFNEMYSSLEKLQVKMDAQTRADHANGRLDERIDLVLQRMGALGITRG